MTRIVAVKINETHEEHTKGPSKVVFLSTRQSLLCIPRFY